MVGPRVPLLGLCEDPGTTRSSWCRPPTPLPLLTGLGPGEGEGGLPAPLSLCLESGPSSVLERPPHTTDKRANVGSLCDGRVRGGPALIHGTKAGAADACARCFPGPLWALPRLAGRRPSGALSASDLR